MNILSCIDVNTKQLRHSSWSKLIMILEKIKDYEYIVYIDSDCIFKNFEISLEDIINKYNVNHFLFQSATP